MQRVQHKQRKTSPWYKAKWALWLTILLLLGSAVPSYYDMHVAGKLTWGSTLRIAGGIIAAMRTLEEKSNEEQQQEKRK